MFVTETYLKSKQSRLDEKAIVDQSKGRKGTFSKTIVLGLLASTFAHADNGGKLYLTGFLTIADCKTYQSKADLMDSVQPKATAFKYKDVLFFVSSIYKVNGKLKSTDCLFFRDKSEANALIPLNQLEFPVESGLVVYRVNVGVSTNKLSIVKSVESIASELDPLSPEHTHPIVPEKPLFSHFNISDKNPVTFDVTIAKSKRYGSQIFSNITELKNHDQSKGSVHKGQDLFGSFLVQNFSSNENADAPESDDSNENNKKITAIVTSFVLNYRPGLTPYVDFSSNILSETNPNFGFFALELSDFLMLLDKVLQDTLNGFTYIDGTDALFIPTKKSTKRLEFHCGHQYLSKPGNSPIGGIDPVGIGGIDPVGIGGLDGKTDRCVVEMSQAKDNVYVSLIPNHEISSDQPFKKSFRFVSQPVEFLSALSGEPKDIPEIRATRFMGFTHFPKTKAFSSSDKRFFAKQMENIYACALAIEMPSVHSLLVELFYYYSLSISKTHDSLGRIELENRRKQIEQSEEWKLLSKRQKECRQITKTFERTK